MSQTQQYHARAISMEFYNDSSDDEAILYEDDSDNDDDATANSGSSSTNPHPITSFQSAFDESIADSAEQYRTGKPALELSSISAEERRKRLLLGEDYNDTYSAMWRENPCSKVHPLKKIVAQITYGVHLLHVQMAVSNEEVVKILQRHIDQVDELIRRADEDLGMALADIEMRISHLKFALADRTTFDVMLENRSYRSEILRGNDLIEDMIKRTENLLEDLLSDIQVGHESIKEMSIYMGRIGSTWPMSTTDLGIYNTMLLNTEGWLECFDSLKLEGKSLSGCLMQLSALVEEMARRAENASKKQALASKSSASPGLHSMTVPNFPTRQSSSSVNAKVISKNPSPTMQTPSGNMSPSERLSTSAYTPPRMPTDNINLPVRRKTNISERRATAISEKRSSTATIASLFIGADDEDPPPELPQMPQQLKSKKSVKKSRIPKMPKMTRPRQISISTITGRSRAGSEQKKDSEQGQVADLTQSSTNSIEPQAVPVQDQQIPTASTKIAQTKVPVLRALEQLSGTSLAKDHAQSFVQTDGPVALDSSPSPDPVVVIEPMKDSLAPSDQAASPALLTESSGTSLLDLHPPQPSFVESPVLGSPTLLSSKLSPSPMRVSPSSSPAPSIIVRRKPLPNSAASSAAPTPKIQHSPQPSSIVRAVEQPSVVTDGNLTPELVPPPKLHKHQPSKSSLLSEPVQIRSISPVSTTSSTSPTLDEPWKTSSSVVDSPVESPQSEHMVLVPQVPPLLDDPIDMDMAPLDSRHLELQSDESLITKTAINLNRLSISSDGSYESSIVPLSELAHPFRSTSPPLVPQRRSDSPAEGLGIDFPSDKFNVTSREYQPETQTQPKSDVLAEAEKLLLNSAMPRKVPMPQEMIIEEEPEPKSVAASFRSASPAEDRGVSSELSHASQHTSVASIVPKNSLEKTEVFASPSTAAADSMKMNSMTTTVKVHRNMPPPQALVKKPEVYQPKSAPKMESPMSMPEVAIEPFSVSFDDRDSPLPFLHSATHSTCHSASMSVASNVNKALPAIPREGSDYNLSPPQSPMAPSFFSSFSLGRASDSGHESYALSQSGGRADFDLQPPLRSHPPKPIDTKVPGMRAMSPLGPDSAYSTGTFASSIREESGHRPQTSRSLKPSRSKLALFPHTSPSMLDLRTKSDMALAGVERSMTYEDEYDVDVGEDADSALPQHPYPPPRLVPRSKDGGRQLGNGGMQKVGTKLKSLFGRNGQKGVGIS